MFNKSKVAVISIVLVALLAAAASTVRSVWTYFFGWRSKATLVMVGPGYRLWSDPEPPAARHITDMLGVSNRVDYFHLTMKSPSVHWVIFWQETWNSKSPKCPASLSSLGGISVKKNSEIAVVLPSRHFAHFALRLSWRSKGRSQSEGAEWTMPKSKPEPTSGKAMFAQWNDAYSGIKTPPQVYPAAWRGKAQCLAICDSVWGSYVLQGPNLIHFRNPALFPGGLIGITSQGKKVFAKDHYVVTYIQVATGPNHPPYPALHNGRLVFTSGSQHVTTKKHAAG